MNNTIHTKICALLSPPAKLLSFFDFDTQDKRRFVTIVTALFVIIFFSISAMFVTKAVSRSKPKNLWVDEKNGISARNASYADLIQGKLATQVSKAPLEYLLQKTFDEVGKPYLFERIPENVYYRLHSIFYNCVSGLCVILIVLFNIKRDPKNYILFGVQALLLGAALWLYYFWPYNFRFSLEMRPYALWNSLWFVIVALFPIYKQFRWPIVVLLILLAATASSSTFQLCSLAGSFLIIKLLQKEKFWDVGIKILKAFSIPLAVSLYYIWVGNAQVYGWHEGYEKYMKEFFHFWLTKEMIPILSIVGILITVPFKKLRDHTIVFLAILILYLLSPLINYLVLNKRVFFSSRHYLYYDLIYPIFLINIALVIPFYWEKIKQYCNDNGKKIGSS